MGRLTKAGIAGVAPIAEADPGAPVPARWTAR
jgi:hypothetical protein